LAVAGEVRTYTVADPQAKGGQRTRVIGTLQPARRAPSPDEVKRINESLAHVEKKLDGETKPSEGADVSEAEAAKPKG
jgi:hypothetical protein